MTLALRPASCVLLLLAVAELVRPAQAPAEDWKSFVPRAQENGAIFETFASHERDDTRSGAHTEWHDTFIREKMTVFSIGYSYHPQFLRYRFSVSGIGKQEQYESSTTEHLGWNADPGVEYDFNLLLFPERAYNAEGYVRRFEPVFKEQSASHHDSVQDTRGVSLRYRGKPYFAHASFDDDDVDSGDVTSHIQRLSVGSEYFKRYGNGYELSVNGAVNPTWFDNSEGIDGSSLEYSGGGMFDVEFARLYLNAYRNEFDQENAQEKFKADQTSVYDLLTLRLPWNFRGDLSYRIQENDSEIREDFPRESRDFSDDNKDVQFDLFHRLYDSVDTNYRFEQDWHDSSGGDTTAQSHSVSVNYTKTIPWESRFLAGGQFTTVDTDSNGHGADIVNEPYSAVAVPGSFTLRQNNVDVTSVNIFLRSPLPPFEAILLVENVHYLLVPTGSTFEVRILTLPAEFVVPGTYDFFATYSLLSGDFDLRTDVAGGNVSVELFSTLLTPYFSYVQVRSDVLSGEFPGNAIDSTTYTTGLIFRYDGLRVTGEYQELHWDVSPYDAWRAELQYVLPVDPVTSVYSSASYLNKHYGKGTGLYYDSAFTEEVETGVVNVRRQIIENMFLTVGGSYTHRQGITDGDSYSANSSWVWNVGKTELSAGVTAYGADSHGSGTISTNRDHQLVYFKLRRRLF